MKNVLIGLLAFTLSVITFSADAQRRTVKRYKGEKGTVTVVKKKRTRGQVRRTRIRRAKRTRVVHYHYRTLPRRGAVVTTVNAKAVSVRYRGINYRYHAGIWYRPNGAKWIVARPAIGVRIRVLPTGYRRIVIGPSTYYYYYGTYYVKKKNEYVVVEAPMDAQVDSLPEGYNTITYNGEEYYELDGTYYMPTVTDDGEEVLAVVENPTL